MIRQVCSTPSCRVNRVLSPTIAACSSTSYGVGALAALRGELHVEVDRLGSAAVRALGVERSILMPVDGSSLITSWFGVRPAGPIVAKPSRGGCLNTSRSSVWVTGRCLPVRM